MGEFEKYIARSLYFWMVRSCVQSAYPETKNEKTLTRGQSQR